MERNNQVINSLHDLLDYDASNFIAAEAHLEQNMRGWIEKATSVQLKTVLHKYQEFIKQHEQKMNAFYEDEKIYSVSVDNQVMKAFISETNTKISNCQDPEILDACLLACVQSINHYKISAYGTAAAFAFLLEMDSHGKIFRQAEIEEKQIDDRLSQLAEHEINAKAKRPTILNG